jgi:hypothetical protein
MCNVGVCVGGIKSSSSITTEILNLILTRIVFYRLILKSEIIHRKLPLSGPVRNSLQLAFGLCMI